MGTTYVVCVVNVDLGANFFWFLSVQCNILHGTKYKSLAACVYVSLYLRVRAHGTWGRISRKRLEIEPRFQWDNNRKWHMRIDWSRDRWRHVALVGQVRDPNIWAHYHENGWRYRLGYKRAPTGNGTRGIKWSLDWLRHVTGMVNDCHARYIWVLDGNVLKSVRYSAGQTPWRMPS